MNQLYGTVEIANGKIWTKLKKGYLIRILNLFELNHKWTNYMEANIFNIQLNIKLFEERDNMQKHKRSTRLGTTGGGKGIHWELCKKLKLDYTIKWYMNETHEIFGHFLKTNGSPNPVQTTRPWYIKKKKRVNLTFNGLYRSSRQQS